MHSLDRVDLFVYIGEKSTAMIFLFFWFVGSLIVGAVGAERTIGFWGSFLISLITSPLLGFIITLFYKTNETAKREKESLAIQKAQLAVLQEKKTNQQTLTEKLAELETLKNNGTVTQEEYQTRRNKLIAAID